MLSQNPHSGIYEADTARTLDLNGGNPGCNQGGMAVVQNITLSDVAASRLAQDGRGGVHSQMMSDPEKKLCHLRNQDHRKWSNGSTWFT